MSYDLFFTSPIISKEQFINYFKDRPNYTINKDQAFYENEDTGVYFIFDYNGEVFEKDSEEVPASVSFNINYYRPHFFGLEAAPELLNFVNTFQFTILDVQNDGMGEGPFSVEGFLKSWNAGNEFGYQSLLHSESKENPIYARPTVELENNWRWNFEKKKRYDIIQKDKFIPKISYILLNDKLVSWIVWPDATPTLIPKVDYIYILRDHLAPKKWFRKKGDQFLLPFQRAISFLEEYKTDQYGLEAYDLPYPQTPKVILDFVSNLKPTKDKTKAVSSSSVLNLELVEKYYK